MASDQQGVHSDTTQNFANFKDKSEAKEAEPSQDRPQFETAQPKGIGHKILLQSDALYQYILETSVYPREHEAMKDVRELTENDPRNVVTTSADEVQFLSMLVKLINAKNTMETGVFTGHSLLTTALALPPDGKILDLDINRQDYELGLPIIEKAGVAYKVDFREGPIFLFLTSCF